MATSKCPVVILVLSRDLAMDCARSISWDAVTVVPPSLSVRVMFDRKDVSWSNSLKTLTGCCANTSNSSMALASRLPPAYSRPLRASSKASFTRGVVLNVRSFGVSVESVVIARRGYDLAFEAVEA